MSIMSDQWRDHIVSSPEILRGKARLRGTRIPVSLILGYLAEGYDYGQIRAEHPDVTEQHIAASLAYARDLAESETAAA